MDKLSKEKRSQVMRAVKNKNTRLEIDVSKELWRRGLRFRKNVNSLAGRPDIVIKKYKFVLFVDSCFWHGCPIHFRTPKSNVEFWVDKINRNIERDITVNNYYKEKGWNVVRVWEHDLKKDFTETIDSIMKELKK